MTRAAGNVLAGAVTLVAGLGLWLFAGEWTCRWSHPPRRAW